MIGQHKIKIGDKEETLFFTMLQTEWMYDLIKDGSGIMVNAIALVLSSLRMSYWKKGEDCPYTERQIQEEVDEWLSNGSETWEEVEGAYQQSNIYKRLMQDKSGEKKTLTLTKPDDSLSAS